MLMGHAKTPPGTKLTDKGKYSSPPNPQVLYLWIQPTKVSFLSYLDLLKMTRQWSKPTQQLKGRLESRRVVEL